jgi:hypothetical protein
MGRRRVRLLRWVLAVAVLLLLLLGRGLGLLPTGSGESRRTDEVGRSAAGPGSGPGSGEAASALDDRDAALASAVRQALAEGRVAAAGHALATLRAVGGAGKQALADLEAAVQRGTAQGCDGIAAAIEAGEVFRAERQVAALLDGGSDGGSDASSTKALAALAAGRGWPALDGEARAAARAPAATAPFGSDRAVTWCAGDGEPVGARVVSVRDGEAVLKLVSPRGVTFPSVPLWQLEPESPSPAEAAALGQLALQAGHVRRARLWCACALARGGAPPLIAALRAQLP